MTVQAESDILYFRFMFASKDTYSAYTVILVSSFFKVYQIYDVTQVAGHTATLVQTYGKKEKMVVIFGYSPQYGYLNTVQEYYMGTREWQIVQTVGFPVKGGYGHTSAYDPLTNLIYVYGGYVSESQSTQVLINRLYSYHPNYREWTLLTSAPSARFFHTAVFVSGGMMIDRLWRQHAQRHATLGRHEVLLGRHHSV